MTTATAERKTTQNRDFLGCRIGEIPAAINAQLTHKPKTAKEIAEAVGTTPRKVVSHFWFWSSKGKGDLFVKTEEGYSLPPKKSAEKKPRARKSRAKAKQSDVITSVEEFNAA